MLLGVNKFKSKEEAPFGVLLVKAKRTNPSSFECSTLTLYPSYKHKKNCKESLTLPNNFVVGRDMSVTILRQFLCIIRLRK